jgi:hypothetical protein
MVQIQRCALYLSLWPEVQSCICPLIGKTSGEVLVYDMPYKEEDYYWTSLYDLIK